MITVTDTAKDTILQLMEQKGLNGHALRVAIMGRGPGGFQYHLQFVPQDSQTPEDQAIDLGQLVVLIDPKTAPDLQGSTLDFVEEIHERGFKIDNPNPLWKDPLALQVQQVLDMHINPAVASHGGFVTLLDVSDQTAYVAFGGGCVGCGLVDVTLKQGVDHLIRQEVPQIRRVIDTTDHASGTNPYYQPAKGGGESPLSR